jgi:hypothetical protein
MNKSEPRVICKLLFTVLSIASLDLSAQFSVVSTGKSVSSDSGNISYSVGQSNFKYINANGGSITQGVQQSIIIEELNQVSQSEKIFEIEFYPNPTSNELFILHKKVTNLDFEVLDATSKSILKGQLKGESSKIELLNYPAGIYFIKLYDTPSKTTRTFKISKK